MNEMAAPIKKGVEKDSRPIALIINPDAIHPSEPKSRIRENSFDGLERLANEMELVSAMVGMKQILYNNNTGKKSEKCSIRVSQTNKIEPVIFRKASTLFAEKKRSAIIPIITGEMMEAMAAVPYARPI